MGVERILPGTLWRETEFVGGLTGACGPNALAMAESWATQSHVGTLEVYNRMRAAGHCAPNGPSTLAELAAQASVDGFTTSVLAYREPMPETDWRAFLDAHAGLQAVVVEVANGQALQDAIGGQGENARGLQYHFLTVVGWHPGGTSARVGRELPAGWWCADGDNFAQGDVLQFYPDMVFAAARPCGAVSLAARVAPAREVPQPAASATAPHPTQPAAGQPAGFYGLVTTADADTWHCPQTGMRLSGAFRNYYAGLRGEASASATSILGLPVSEAYPWHGLTRQDFERGSLVYDPSHHGDPWTMYFAKIASELQAARDAATQAQAQATTAGAQLADAERATKLLQALKAALS